MAIEVHRRGDRIPPGKLGQLLILSPADHAVYELLGEDWETSREIWQRSKRPHNRMAGVLRALAKQGAIERREYRPGRFQYRRIRCAR